MRIVARILNSAKTPKLQSELLIDTVVSRSTLSRYLSLLIFQGLLEQVEEDGRKKLKTTPKGMEYLKSHGMLSQKSWDSGDPNRKQKYTDRKEEEGEKRSNSQANKGEMFHRPNWDITPNIV
jgi:predicted transcriptional regulator